jgi:hypothetical protein
MNEANVAALAKAARVTDDGAAMLRVIALAHACYFARQNRATDSVIQIAKNFEQYLKGE